MAGNPIHATPTAAAIRATITVATAEALVRAIKNAADPDNATPAQTRPRDNAAVKAHRHARAAVKAIAAATRKRQQQKRQQRQQTKRVVAAAVAPHRH
ncbi:MAG: hypothetical protein U0V87_17885 [Acidobacteriota bacterium]